MSDYIPEYLRGPGYVPPYGETVERIVADEATRLSFARFVTRSRLPNAVLFVALAVAIYGCLSDHLVVTVIGIAGCLLIVLTLGTPTRGGRS